MAIEYPSLLNLKIFLMNCWETSLIMCGYRLDQKEFSKSAKKSIFQSSTKCPWAAKYYHPSTTTKKNRKI